MLFGVRPDITCLGKIIGGGLPLAAFGGRKKIMERLAPLGNVYQAGTLSGNPCAVSAGIAQLARLKRADYPGLERAAEKFCLSLAKALYRRGIPATLNRAGSLFTVFFTGSAVTDYASARSSDTARYAAYFRSMLENGVMLPPSQFGANFLSFSHGPADLRRALGAFEKAIGGLR